MKIDRLGYALMFTLAASACSKHEAEKPVVAVAAESNTEIASDTDADMQAVLNKLAALKPKALDTLTPAEARTQPTVADAVKAKLKSEGKSTKPEALLPDIIAADRIVVTETGANIPARFYKPEGKGPFPVIVYFHGGGFVIADKDVYDASARALSKQANAIVVSPDYRLAPENKFPAAHQDAYSVYKWATANAAAFGGDPKRIALAGESAGGNLAIATAITARDAEKEQPYAVLAIYPIAQVSMQTESYQKYADAKPLNRAMMQWFLKNYTRTPEDLQDPRLDLVHAKLKGLPPVTIINAGIDPLLDDGAQLEAALKEAEVPVTRHVYEGVTHEFFGTAALVEDAKEAQAVAGKALSGNTGVAAP